MIRYGWISRYGWLQQINPESRSAIIAEEPDPGISFLRNLTLQFAPVRYALAALLIAGILTPGLHAGVALVAASEQKTSADSSTPSIVVSIKPLHSLVSAVTQGVTEPVLLFDGFSSPHTTQLKPSMMRQLRKADLLVWVGAGVEVYLDRVVADQTPRSGVISFAQIDGIQRLPFRFDDHRHGDPAEFGSGKRGADADKVRAELADSVDFHVWLDPGNARELVMYLAEYLSDIDSSNAESYDNNAQQMLATLSQLDQQLELLLGGLADVPFLVFHDSFQYLEKRYQLHRALVIAEQPEVQPGARRLKRILQRVESQQVKCLFTEPQFPARVLSMLQRDSSVEVATLDPLASGHDAGPDLYADWLLELGQTMHDCLSP